MILHVSMLLNQNPPNNKDISPFSLNLSIKKNFTSYLTRFGSSIHLPSLNRSSKPLVFLLRITKLWKYLVLSPSLSHCVLVFCNRKLSSHDIPCIIKKYMISHAKTSAKNWWLQIKTIFNLTFPPPKSWFHYQSLSCGPTSKNSISYIYNK